MRAPSDAAMPAVLAAPTAAPGQPAPELSAADALLRPPPAAFADLLAAADAPAAPSGLASSAELLAPATESGPVKPAPLPVRPSAARRLQPAEAEQAPIDPALLALAVVVPAPVPVEPAAELVSAPAEATTDEAEAPVADSSPEDRPAALPLFLRARDLYSSGNDKAAPAPVAKATPGLPPAAELPAPTDDTPPDDTPAPAAPREIPAAAVFAGPSPQRSLPVVPGVDSLQKNNAQATVAQEKTITENSGGMEKAKGVVVMSPAVAQLHSSAAAVSRRAVEGVKLSASSAEPASGSSSSSASPGLAPQPPSVSAPTPSTVLSETAPASTPVPAAALRLIERVDEVAERVASRAPEQVKISLDLEGSHRVEVKVAMRGGRVFADFRTDSAEMRAALTQAWDGFVRGRESSTHRWADPVFSSLGASSAPSPEAAPAGAPSSGSFAGDSSSRQDAAADQRQAPRRELPAEQVAFALASSPSARPTSAPSAPAAPRPDPSRLLSALA